MAVPSPSAPGYDLFISYAREDQEFVRQLAKALDTQQRRVWVDWQGIPPSVDWMREVYAAIEAAQCFVFVLSEASLNSTVCADEVKHAVVCHKRLIPVALGTVDDKLVPDDLRRANWVPCRAPEDFETALAALVQAIDTDFDWVRDHTRLLVRAVEWQNAGKEASRLLRGMDLQRAEEWLAKAADRDPLPTDLHSTFILTSRAEQTKRSRRTLAGVVAALVVAIGLAVMAWLQRGEAVAQREQATAQRTVAEDQRNRAELNRLDAVRQSIAALTNESAVSLRQGLELEGLLAALRAAATLQREALLRQPSVALYRTAVALRQAAFQTHERNRFVTNEFRGVTHLAFTADDSGLYAAGGGGTIRQWSLAGRSVSSFETGHSGTADGCTSIANMALARDQQTLLTLGKEGVFAQWTPAGVKMSSFDTGAYNGGDSSCSGIISSTIDVEHERITIRDWRSVFVRTFQGELVETRPANDPNDSDFKAAEQTPVGSPTGLYDARVTGDREVVVTRHSDGVELMRLRNQSSPAFSHDERTLATVSSKVDTSVIHVWNIATAGPTIPADVARPASGQPPKTLTLGGQSVTLEPASSTQERAAVVSSDGNAAARISDVRTGQVELWRLQPQAGAAPQLVTRIATDQIASADFAVVLDSLAFSPDGKVLATGGSDGTVKFWDQQGGLVRRIAAHRQDARALFSPDGVLMLTWSESAEGIELKLWSANGELLDTMTAPGWSKPRFSSDGRWIVATAPAAIKGAPPAVRAWPLALDVLVRAGCDRLQTYFDNPASKVEPELCAAPVR